MEILNSFLLENQIYFLYYLFIINLFSSIVFIIDKKRAKNNKSRSRISENFLHLLELLGGVFIIIILMQIIRHKNRKLKYFWITYLILIIWIIGMIYFY